MDFPTSNVQWTRELPKVELHAHLNGCIREATLFELARERGINLNQHHFSDRPLTDHDHSMYNSRPRSLQDCFEMFAEIATCVDDLPSLARITMEALQDFAEHHVAYLELRSTPKQLLVQSGQPPLSDKRAYCMTILQCLQRFESKEISRYESELVNCKNTTSLPRLPMMCRFIVAIDRSQSVQQALEHVDLALSLRQEYNNLVVGVDLGGNPTKNHFNDFRDVFEKARHSGLKITLHCGEVPCNDQDETTQTSYLETKSVLDFVPDRLGHALLLPPSLQQILRNKKIPVECCPTSNVMTLELAQCHSGSLLEGLKTHPQLASWLESAHPISIGTDDPGVFNTTNTKELLLVQEAFRLNRKTICDIIIGSIDQAFCDTETKTQLKKHLIDRMERIAA